MRAYLDDEVLRSIGSLREDGYTPATYAYPFGTRTSEHDEAILRYLRQVRSLTYAYDGPLIAQPVRGRCPESGQMGSGA